MARTTTTATLKTFHATVAVTRLEEWCVEAATLEEARALLASGAGHRCSVGDRLNVDLERLHNDADPAA